MYVFYIYTHTHVYCTMTANNQIIFYVACRRIVAEDSSSPGSGDNFCDPRPH